MFDIDVVLIFFGDMFGIIFVMFSDMMNIYRSDDGVCIVVVMVDGKCGNLVLWDWWFFDVFKLLFGDMGV